MGNNNQGLEATKGDSVDEGGVAACRGLNVAKGGGVQAEMDMRPNACSPKSAPQEARGQERTRKTTVAIPPHTAVFAYPSDACVGVL